MAWPDVGPNQHAQNGGRKKSGGGHPIPALMPRGRYGAHWPGPGNPDDTPRGRAWIASKRRLNNADPVRRRTYGRYDTRHGQGRYHHPGWWAGNIGGGKGK